MRRVMMVFAVVVLLYAMLDRIVESMVFQPTPGAQLGPVDVGVEAEDVFLHAKDGVKIHSFLLPAPESKRALLFLHGNAGNASHRLPNAAELRRLGCSVLLLDYRGYGRSEGRPSEAGVYRDSQAGLDYLVETLKVPIGRVTVFGRSLGGAVAVDLARDRALAGVILESTFSSLSDLGRTIGGRLFSFLAGGRFASIDKIALVRAPLLFFHGDQDQIVDHTLGHRLFEAARSPKSFETIRGAGHNDTIQVGGRAYFERIGAFLDEVAPVE